MWKITFKIEAKDMAKYFYTEHSNHILNLTTTVQKKRRAEGNQNLHHDPSPTTWYYDEVANFRLFWNCKSDRRDRCVLCWNYKDPLNTNVPESTVVVAEYIQIGCEAVNVILNAISRL